MLFVNYLSLHVIGSLDLSTFFAQTMVAGVLLLATPAILGFYISVSPGRVISGRSTSLAI